MEIKFLQMKRALHTSLIVLMLSVVGMTKTIAQQPQQIKVSDINLSNIKTIEERVFIVHSILEKGYYCYTNTRLPNTIDIYVSSDASDELSDFGFFYDHLLYEQLNEFSSLDKTMRGELFVQWRQGVDSEVFRTIYEDFTRGIASENATCETALPFTANGAFSFSAGVNSSSPCGDVYNASCSDPYKCSGTPGQSSNCLSTAPNPAFYYIRITSPGDLNIYLESTPSVDIDFDCWGPFDDITTACGQLSCSNIVDCSYSSSHIENCHINNAQTGEYYILLITNYSNRPCEISFENTGTGSGGDILITTEASPIEGGTVTGTGFYSTGETCTVSAIANSGYIFVNWTENGTPVSTNATYTFSVTGNRTLVANFRLSCSITATSSPSEGGTVAGSGVYAQGTSCTLTATPSLGFSFVNWTESDTVVSTEPNISFTAYYDRTFVANFEIIMHHINVEANLSAAGSVSGGGDYQEGFYATVSAQPNEGFEFIHWTENGASVSTNPNYMFAVWAPRNLVADFKMQITDTMAYTCNTFNWHGHTYSSSGVYYDTLSSYLGIDSIVALHLTVYPSYHYEYTETECGNYFWEGVVYSESGDYSREYQSIYGCDSTFTLHLTILPVRSLGNFTYMSPANNYIDRYTDMDFYWDAIPNANCYDFYFWQGEGGKPNTPMAANITSHSYQVGGLTHGATYHWCVVAKNECEENESATRTFTCQLNPSMTVVPNGWYDFGEVEVGESLIRTISVSGTALTEDISYTYLDNAWGQDAEFFTITPSNWNPTSGGLLHVTFTPEATQLYYNVGIRIASGVFVDTLYFAGSLADRYVFTTNVEGEIYSSNDEITITGHVEDILGNSVSNMGVNVYLIVMGTRITLPTVSDSNGNYTVTYTPRYSESGYYQVGSCAYGYNSNDIHDAFDIPGMSPVSSDFIIWQPYQYETLTGMVEIRNRSRIPINNIQINSISLPNGCSVSFTGVTDLGPLETGQLYYTVTGAQVTSGNSYEEALFQVAADNGLTMNMTCYYYCRQRRGTLDVYPTSIATSMKRYNQKVLSFQIANNGNGETGPITISLPNVEWMSLMGSDTLESLPVGDSCAFSIILAPDENVNLVQYTGSIAVNSANGNGISIPYVIDATSDSTGVLRVDVTDDNTYNGNGDHLAGAFVQLKGYYSLEIVSEGETDENGLFIVENVSEGYYYLTIHATEHKNYEAGIIYIEGGKTNYQNIYLQYQAISYSWVVIPTEIEDEYEFELVADIKTNVPVPVVTVDCPSRIDTLAYGDTIQFNLMVTNHGLVDAYETQLTMPTEFPEYDFIPMIDFIDTLQAKTSVLIPCIVTRTQRNRFDIGNYHCNIGKGRTVSGYWCNSKKEWVEFSFTFRFRVHCDYSGPDNPIVNFPPLLPPTPTPPPAYCPECVPTPPPSGPEHWPWPTDPTNGFDDIATVSQDCTPCWKVAASSVFHAIEAFTGVPIGAFADFGFYWNENISYYRDIIHNVKTNPTSLLTQVGPDAMALKDCITATATIPSHFAPSYGWKYNLYKARLAFQEHTSSLSSAASGLASIVSIISRLSECITFSIRDDSEMSIVMDQLEHSVNYYQSALNEMTNLFHDEEWLEEENFDNFVSNFQAVIDTSNYMISSQAAQYLKDVCELTNVNDSIIQRFVDRWNRSVQYWNEDIYTIADLPEGYNDDFIQLDSLMVLPAIEANGAASAYGFESLSDMYNSALDDVYFAVQDHKTDVCAKISVSFKQTMTMTREAFEGTLKIFNGHATDPMQDINVDIVVKDANGVDRTDLFQINVTSLNDITGVDGTGTLDAQTEGFAQFLMIPTIEAAPDTTKIYYFGGSFSFLDPFSGSVMTYDLYPVQLKVNPGPNLHVDYFISRHIISDDPLTDTIEATEPAELAMMISNVGAGNANNVYLQSAQPQIIENQNGLLISFDIVAAAMNGVPRSLGLIDIPFGTIESHSAGIAEWYFTSTLMARVVHSTPHVIHNDSYGNPKLSLVTELNSHELIKAIKAYGSLEDGINDFFVNETADFNHTPDKIYFSNGGTTDVSKINGAETEGILSNTDNVILLHVNPIKVGWNYACVDDPANGLRQILSCTRDDGQVIPLSNVWVSHVTMLDEGAPVHENKLHIVDTLSTRQMTTYTLYYDQDLHYDIAVTTNPEEGGTVAGGGVYDVGEIVTLEAIPNEGYTFVNWTENGEEVSTDAIYSFTVIGDRNLVANFSNGDDNNLVFNGDFELGNTGFSTDYIYGNTGSYNYYYVGHDIAEMWYWDSPGYIVGDHTSGEGLFMMVDGALEDNTTAWSQTVAVMPNTDYVLSAWFLTNNIGYLRFEINGVSGSDFTTPESSWVWEQQSMTWNSGNCTEATIKIINRFAESGGYDWCVDDIYFGPINSGGSHEYVDLGLPSGTLWATCNVGANAPEEYGDYFAWGETTPKDSYYVFTYQYCVDNFNTLTKYCSNPESGYNGFTDNLTTLLSEDDAATVNWGNGWRMPTMEEFQELYNNTTMTWTQQNGVDGRLFTASNGNSLFLPAAGEHGGSILNYAGSRGYYWSSSLCVDQPDSAWDLYFFSSAICGINLDARYHGESVRPVRSSGQNISFVINATSNPPEGGGVSGGGAYPEDVDCTLTATPNEGYTFINWTENGEAVSTEATYSFTVTGNRSLVANFVETGSGCSITFNLNDSFGDGWNGNYLVVSYGDISEQLTIEDGSSASYNLEIPDGSHVELTWISGSWIGECSYTISYENGNVIYYGSNMSSGFSYGFDEDCVGMPATIFDIMATADPVNGGTVTGTGEFEYGSTCTLTATANEGYTFMYWTLNGNQVSSASVYSFIVTGDGNLVAHFTLPLNIATSANPAEGGTVSGFGSYDYGATCTLTATSNEGYVFLNWTENGTQVYKNPTYEFTVTRNRTLEANFISIASLLYVLSDDFNDGVINSDYWIASGPDIIEEDGMIKMQQNETDAYVALESVPMRIPSNNQIVIDRSFFVHEQLYNSYWGDHYYYGSLNIRFNGDEDNLIGICYYDDDYENRHGTYLINKQDGEVTETRICDATFDAWLSERIVLDLANETLTYYLNNAFVSTLNVPGIASQQMDYYTVWFNPYGWWTGHYHNMDYVNINVDDMFLLASLSDDFNDGVIAPELWTYTGNAVLEEDGLLKLQQNVTDQDVHLRSVDMQIPENGKVIMDRRFMVHYSYEYYYGRNTIRLNGDSNSFIQIDYIYTYYYDDSYHNDLKTGIYLITKLDGELSEVRLCDLSFDTWLTEYVEVDFTAGTLSYIMDTLVATVTIPGLAEQTVNYYNVEYGPYGWWTGHQHYMDYINITPESSSIIAATVEPADGGTVTGGGTFEFGQTCTLTATPNEGYNFMYWTENGVMVSSDAIYSFIVTGDRDLVANFSEGESVCNIVFDLYDSYGDGYTGNYLVVSYGGITEQFTVESGSFASYSREIATGSDISLSWIQGSYPEDCSFDIKFENGVLIYHGSNLNDGFQHELDINCAVANAPRLISAIAIPEEGGSVMGADIYEEGSTCTLTALPNEGYRFYYWAENGGIVSSEANYSFVVSANRELLGIFGPPLLISATANPTEGGTVSGAGEYDYNSTCTLTATANEGYTFMYWTENGQQVSSDATYSFTVTSSRNLVAHFSLPLTINLSVEPMEGGTATGSGIVDYGNTCTLTATPNPGYLFSYWTKNGNVVSYVSPYSFTVTENADYVAHFEVAPEEGICIGNPESANQYLPSYSVYNYTLSQQIYTASEIGTVGLINTLSFYNTGGTKTRNYDIYLVHTDKTTFESATDWITVTEVDHVYSGDVDMTQGYWTTIVLDTPFAYDGISNLAVVVDDNSGNWTGWPYMDCRVFNTNDVQAIQVYSDGTNYDPFNPSGYIGTRHSVKNQIILGFSSTCHFIIAGNWSTASNWSNGTLPQTVDEVFIDAPCQLDQDAKVAMLTVSGGQSLTLQSGQTLTVTNTLNNTSTLGLIIEDGAQLVHASENVSAMVKKNIAGHATSNGKYCLISSPLTEAVDPEMSNVYHLLRGSYDLYDWLPSASDRLEWRNFKDNNFMMYPDGFGYLYANRNGVELNFPGILNPSRYRFGKSVSYDSNDTEHPGWNLIGNPFMCNAKLVNANNEPVSYYRMNAAGDGFVADTSGAIAPMEGVFYQASENGTVYFVRADNTSQIPTFTISVSASPSDGGSVSGGTYRQGQIITLRATASDGFAFVNWTENGEMVSTDVNYTFTVDGDRVLVANFTGDHAYVDLGLPSGLLWATCNVGADTPEGYGDYFAWGETQPKDTYDGSNYQYCMGSYNTLTKYCNNSNYGYNGFTDNLTTLLPEDDAATANWGSGWRMPTKEEWQELYNNTTMTWTQQGGVNGQLFTASNGNSLFLPASGNLFDDEFSPVGFLGYYWSSSLDMDRSYCAWYFFSADNYGMYSNYGRSPGFTVRPVREN